MASRTSITLENLKALGADKLARLVLDETASNAAFKRQVTAALAGLAGPQAVAKIVDRRLAGLEGAKSFVDWDKARAFRDDLQSVVETILSELAKPAPDIATDRLLRFIATHETVFERVDDSNGSVQDVYYQAIEAVGSIAEHPGAQDAAALPERIMTALGETSHGYLVDVTEAVAPHLPKPVLDDWEAELASRIERRAEKERTRATDRWHYSMTSQWREMRQIIAGARGDLDLLMRLEREKPPHARDTAGIAARLLDAGRPSEALDWVREPLLRPGRSEPDRPTPAQLLLEARILRGLDRYAEAAGLLWQGFAETLDAELLRAHLKALPDFEDIDVEERALALAREHSEPLTAVRFFLEWSRLDDAAGVVVAHRATWDGGDWHILPQIAEALGHDRPLAATILYRALLDSILERARTKAYPHGVRYLTTLKRLAPTAENDPGWPTDLQCHADYVAELRTAHGRKAGFWNRVNAA
ncbi:MAG: DUF6880 family protein [Pseudomonadota bacterium]